MKKAQHVGFLKKTESKDSPKVRQIRILCIVPFCYFFAVSFKYKLQCLPVTV